MSQTLYGDVLPCSPSERVVLAHEDIPAGAFAAPQPGTWFILGDQLAICCPRCALVATMSPDHSVSNVDDTGRGVMRGDVSTVIKCPRCESGYYAHLDSWGGAGAGRA